MWTADEMTDLLDPDMPGYAEAVRGDSSVVGGYFRRKYAEAFGVVAGNSPTFRCHLAGAPVVGEALTIDGVIYTVAQQRDEGMGWALLELDLS